jgi:hypothetical protein
MQDVYIPVILEAYKTRVELLKCQGDRLWNRFNYFLAIDAALFGVMFGSHNMEINIIGILFSLIWYFMATNDRFYLKTDRDRLKAFEKDVLCKLVEIPELYSTHKFKIGLFKSNILFLSTSNFSVILPILFIAIWLFYLFA